MTPHAAYEKYLNRKASSQTHLQRSHIHLARCTAHAHSPCSWSIKHSQAVGYRAGGLGATTSQQRSMSSSGWWVQQLHNKTHVEEMSKVECGGHTLTPCSDWQLLMAPMTAFWDASMPFMNCVQPRHHGVSQGIHGRARIYTCAASSRTNRLGQLRQG